MKIILPGETELEMMKDKLVELTADHAQRLLWVSRSDLYFSSQRATSASIKEPVAVVLAAAWMTSPACEWEHFYAIKSKPVQVSNIALRITAFVTNVSVKGVHRTAQTLFHTS